MHTVKAVTLCQKEFQRVGLRKPRSRKGLADGPTAMKLCRRLAAAQQRIVYCIGFLLQFNIRVVVWQVEETTRPQHSRPAVAIEREEPDAGHSITDHVSAHIQFVHGAKSRQGG